MKKRIMRKLHKLSCTVGYIYTTPDGYKVLMGSLTSRQDWLLKKKHRREYLGFLYKLSVEIKREIERMEREELKKEDL